ncbi:hypothetical protein EV191_11079 [Tamaricihabitans halophyticus]|uniref:Amidohydrolase-related domain-containing protein n=1 Tax=Tamaricihabitans halophyticus TaxID=1262583 RepID=A0A4R2QH02_9PSEU|nr:amidohydrolase family protein [Tamaricihabitans halophyticus]TCP48522.1 hypothetical protein EV191_11079 [Tamaricihabitans halophyticus]
MNSQQQIIDVAGMVFDEDCWEAYLRTFAEYAPDYATMLARRLAVTAGFSPIEFADGPVDDLLSALRESGALRLDLDAYVTGLTAGGIRHQVIHSTPWSLPDGTKVNDRVASFARRHPDRLHAWASVNLADPDEAIAEVRRCYEQLGLRGASVTHFLDVADPVGDGAHAFYRVLEELRMPLWVHTGHNLSRRVPMDWCMWRHLDTIARCHPDLILIAGHGGWPWIGEMMALCQRHPHVYLELSTHRPRHMIKPGSGWESLFAHGASSIRHKVLFGSISWVHGRSAPELAHETSEWPITETVRTAWLHDNAAPILGLSR